MQSAKQSKRPAVPPFPLAAVLERRGMSLAALSEASGLAYTTLAALNRGATRPDWRTLVAIARALGLPLCHFTPDPVKESKHVGFD